jgi:hypothetical protein
MAAVATSIQVIRTGWCRPSNCCWGCSMLQLQPGSRQGKGGAVSTCWWRICCSAEVHVWVHMQCLSTPQLQHRRRREVVQLLWGGGGGSLLPRRPLLSTHGMRPWWCMYSSVQLLLVQHLHHAATTRNCNWFILRPVGGTPGAALQWCGVLGDLALSPAPHGEQQCSCEQ